MVYSGERGAPTLAGGGVGDVQTVGSAAGVAGAVAQFQRRRLAAAWAQRPRARRALERALDQLGGHAHARALDGRAGGGAALAGAGVLHLDAGAREQGQRRLVDAAAGIVVPDPECGSVHGVPLGW